MINVAELDERIDRCLAILADNPHSQVFAALAEAYRRRGDFGRAFSVCKSGLKHHPDYGPAYVVLAKLYLHQKMMPDALNALLRAVELDGPTRVTDVLEAEIQLALGELGAAQAVIDRLRVTDPGNASLPELAQQLKQLRSGPAVQAGASTSVEVDSELPQPPPQVPVEPECSNWQDWVGAIGNLPGVTFAFAAEIGAKDLAQAPESEAVSKKVETVLALVCDIGTKLPDSIWGSIGELRIECAHGSVWVRRLKDRVVGFVGSEQLKYGAARQRGLDLAEGLQNEAVTPGHTNATI